MEASKSLAQERDAPQPIAIYRDINIISPTISHPTQPISSTTTSTYLDFRTLEALAIHTDNVI